MYGRLYLPTGRLDALYSTKLSPALQLLVAAISDPPTGISYDTHTQPRHSASNMMFHLQHDIGKCCTEYTYSVDDGMLGIRFLHNFGRLGLGLDSPPEEMEKSQKVKGMKRVDEEDAVEGGLKGRLSVGGELYISAKERSAGGM